MKFVCWALGHKLRWALNKASGFMEPVCERCKRIIC